MFKDLSKSSSSNTSERVVLRICQSSSSNARDRVVLEFCQSLVEVIQVIESY